MSAAAADGHSAPVCSCFTTNLLNFSDFGRRSGEHFSGHSEMRDILQLLQVPGYHYPMAGAFTTPSAFYSTGSESANNLFSLVGPQLLDFTNSTLPGFYQSTLQPTTLEYTYQQQQQQQQQQQSQTVAQQLYRLVNS